MGSSAYVDAVTRAARVSPDMPARAVLEDSGGSLGHAGLIREATALGRHLGEALPAGSVVGVRLPQGRGCIVSILAARSAGLGVLLLDPRHPPARDAALCEDARVSLLLGDAVAPNGPPSVDPASLLGGGKLIPIDAVALPGVDFVLGTSGSTGRPKAVAHTDSSLIAWGSGDPRGNGYGPADTVLSLSSPATLGGIAGITKCLLGGATMRCLDLATGGFPALVDALRDGRVTAFRGTPSMVRALAAVTGFRDMVRGVRALTLYGEPLSWDDVTAFGRLFQPACRIRNSYGSTEAGGCTWEPGDSSPTGGRVPAGRPNPGVAITVTDAEGNPVARGVEGEVHVSGAQNSLGTLVAGVLARHRPSPHGLATGDLGRILPDGALEVLGRLDRAVKVNGVRIDLSEVEGAVRSCPGVVRAEVVAVPHGPGCRTVAFVLLEGDGNPRDVARRAREMLPGSTAPIVRALDAMPMLPIGKVDVTALLRMAGETG